MTGKNSNNSVLTLILAIGILVVSIFIFAMNYKERSLKLQSAYIKLDKLCRQALEAEKNNSNTDEIEHKYHDILECVENHTECDYLKVWHSIREDKQYKTVNQKFGCTEWMKYGGCLLIRLFIMVVLFVSPIMVMLFIF